MYADTDFIVALIKEDAWLTEAAETVYRENKEAIWTSKYTMLEIFLVSYREDWNTLEVLANVENLIQIDENIDDMLAAARKVEQKEITPFDAIHLTKADQDKIISSDKQIDQYSERLKLEEQ
jgi:predicted nucleic acid-binding protein